MEPNEDEISIGKSQLWEIKTVPDSNISMVAFHGNRKPRELQLLLQELLGLINHHVTSTVPEAFMAYFQDQIHATIIGMEVDLEHGRMLGRWFRRNESGQSRSIDTKLFQQIVKRFVHGSHMFTIRFGGFPESHCFCKSDLQARIGWACSSKEAEFHTFDRSPYEGTFYISGSGPAMLTGWPVEGPLQLRTYPRHLYTFRRAAEEAGFLDKYHCGDKPYWKDDDFFIRVGTFSENLSVDQLQEIEESVRRFLSIRPPTVVDVGIEDISIVLYRDSSLKQENVISSIPLRVFLQDHTQVDRLYAKLWGDFSV
jgi:hypothetical protein